MRDERSFFDLAEQLDALIPLRSPTLEQVEQVVGVIRDEALERYFFRHLAASANPGWFESLRERGFFDTPPEPIRHEGTISFPVWPALWYLVSVAPRFPEEVIAQAEKLRTQSPFIMLDLVRAAEKMPPVYAAKMVPLVIQWADQGMMVERNVISLAQYLAREEQWEDALRIVDLMLSPQGQPRSEVTDKDLFILPWVSSTADRYWVKEFVENDIDMFLDRLPIDVLRIVQKNLEQALEIEGRREPSDSSGWRPAIEAHEQNWSDDIGNLLVDAAVKALSILVERAPEQAQGIVEEYLEHAHSIFWRLAIHTVRLNAGRWPDLLERLFTQETYLEDARVYHEYWLLMQTTYSMLPASIQRGFLSRILAKLPHELAEETLQHHWDRDWVLRRLWAIKRLLPSNEHQEILDELVRAYGEPEHPSFLSYSRSSRGSVSPATPDSLSGMSPEDILAVLRKELPTWPEGFDEPTQEGLADALKAAVKASPEQFAALAPRLCGPDISPLYTYHVIWGFQEAWKENRPFDWQPVLDLCIAVARTGDESIRTGESIDVSPGYWRETYGSARSAVADLLVAGVARDDHAVPHDLLGVVRETLLVLADDPNPSLEYERKRIPERPHGVLDLALNVTRGKAVRGLIQYALHAARIDSQHQSEANIRFAPGSQLERAVRHKLTEKLDKQTDPSLAVHAIFGEFLPNLHHLDEQWLLGQLENIFPRTPEMSAYWEAAWDGYMFRSDFFGYLFENLRPYYQHAIEQMAPGEQGKAGSDFSKGRLARHLAALYWRGMETLEDTDSLIPLFLESAPDEIRAGFVGGIAAGLGKAAPDANSEEWLRAKRLWTTRFQFIAACEEGQPDNYRKESAAYLEWVPHIPEAIDSFYGMIEGSARVSDSGGAIRLLKYLASVAQKHARFAVSVLGQLLGQDREPWFWATGDPTVQTILEAAMSSDNREAQSLAAKAINWFGARGNEHYRGLLKLN